MIDLQKATGNPHPKLKFAVRLKAFMIIFTIILNFAVLGYLVTNFEGGLPDLSSIYRPGLPNCKEEDYTDLTFTADKTWFLTREEYDDNPVLIAKLQFTPPVDCIVFRSEIDFLVAEEVRNTIPMQTGVTEYEYQLDTSGLSLATHTLTAKIKLPSGEEIIRDLKFNVSEPILVAWTLDWEGYALNIDEYLNQINNLTNRPNNGKVPITHFFNPRYFVQPGASATGLKYYEWIKNRMDSHRDVVGLHTHMFYDLVAAAGVEPLEEPTWNSRGTGSDVPLASYNREEQYQILDYSTQILKQNLGLERIDMFRAGGWFADENTMRVLEQLGYTIESSGRTNYVLGNGLRGPWNLSITTQPYYTCKTDQNSACQGGGAFNVLEIPNNGGESFRFDQASLISRFNDNYSGGIASEPKAITYLSHPEWFYVDNPKMDGLFKHIDKYSFNDNKGPVIYVNLYDIQEIWE